MQLVFLTIMAFWGSAQSDFAADDGAAFLDKLDAFYKTVNSIQAEFNQEKQSALLIESSRSSGSFHYLKPDKIRWEQQQPEHTFFVINGDDYIQFDGTKKTSTKRSIQASAFKKFILSTIDGSIFKDKSFAKRFESASDKMKIELTPLDKKMKKHISSIKLTFDETSLMLDEMQIWEDENEATIILFSNQKINAPQPTELFN